MASSTSVSHTVPATDGNRFAVVTDNDRSGVIWVVSILCLIYTLMVFGVRLEARRNNFGLDDALAIISTVIASLQYILIFLANHHGLGKSYDLTSVVNVTTVGKYMLASQTLTLLALGLAKCSVIFLCRRLFTAHRANHRIFCDIGLGVCGIWSIVSILSVTIGCSPVSLLGYHSAFCHNLVTRWIGVGIFDCITEVLIVAMAFDGLFPLQMSVGRKFQALATFLLRLVLILFAVLHMTTLRKAASSADTGVALAAPTVYLQIELLYALFSASIPALNRWLRNFDTSMGSTWIYSSQAYSLNQSEKSQDRSRSRSIPTVNMDGSRTTAESKRTSLLEKRISKTRNARTDTAKFVPAGPKYIATTVASAHSHTFDTQDKIEIPSMNSEEMIIRKDVEWQVQHEEAESVPRTSN